MRVVVDVGEAGTCVGKTVAVGEATTTTGVVAGGVVVGLAQLAESNTTNNNARFNRKRCRKLSIFFMSLVPRAIWSM